MMKATMAPISTTQKVLDSFDTNYFFIWTKPKRKSGEKAEEP
jgi:hypothetical protein